MRSPLARVLPWAVGAAIGWLLLRGVPPTASGAVGVIVALAAAALLFLGFVAFTMERNLPAAVELRPLPPERVPPELQRLATDVAALGFAPAGPALEVGIAPPAVMVPLVNRRERTYSTVFRTGTLPAAVGLDFVSILEGGRGGLTTGADVRGATLRGDDGSLRQVIPGAPPDRLLAAHREAVELLRARGLRCRELDAAAFPADLAAAIARQRRLFLAAPVRSVLVAVWRTLTRRSPHLGPLQRQALAARQIERLAAARN